MEKLSISCFGLDLYVDGDVADAERVSSLLRADIDEVYGIKPDWYYKAKAKNALGLEC